MILFQITHNKLYAVHIYTTYIYIVQNVNFYNKAVVVKPFVVFDILYTFIYQLLLQCFMNFTFLFCKKRKLYDLLLLKLYEVERKLIQKGG